MAIKLVINGRDYSTYLQPFNEQGGAFDPVDSGRISPQFAGVPALSEGGVWVADAVDKRHWQIQLLLKPSPLTVDAAHKLVSDIEQDLYQGATVEYAPEGASNSSFFDLLSGEFRPTYSHALLRNSRVPGLLELFTKPYATTGTYRSIASTTGTGPLSVLATGIIGDTTADLSIEMTVGSYVASAARFLAWSVYPATAPPLIQTTDFASNSPATIVGASGAIGSQYLGLYISPTSVTNPNNLRFTLANATPGHRFRVLAVARSRLAPATALVMRLTGRTFTAAGPSVLATTNNGNWQVIDLGEYTAIDGESQQQLVAGGASGASIIASPALHLNALIALPLDTAAGIAMIPHALVDWGVGTLVVDGGGLAARDVITVRRPPRAGTAIAFVGSPGLAPVRDVTQYHRGAPPFLPPTGSPMASGANTVFVMAGEVDNFRGNDALDVRLTTRDRWSFYR